MAATAPRTRASGLPMETAELAETALADGLAADDGDEVEDVLRVLLTVPFLTALGVSVGKDDTTATEAADGADETTAADETAATEAEAAATPPEYANGP
jgi:hypothetical protein